MCVHAPATLPLQPPMTMLLFPASFFCIQAVHTHRIACLQGDKLQSQRSRASPGFSMASASASLAARKWLPATLQLFSGMQGVAGARQASTTRKQAAVTASIASINTSHSLLRQCVRRQRGSTRLKSFCRYCRYTPFCRTFKRKPSHVPKTGTNLYAPARPERSKWCDTAAPPDCKTRFKHA